MSKDQERADEFCKRLPMLTKTSSKLEEENSWQGMRKQSKQNQEEEHERHERADQFNQGVGRLSTRQRDTKYRLLREGQKVPDSLMYRT